MYVVPECLCQPSRNLFKSIHPREFSGCKILRRLDAPSAVANSLPEDRLHVLVDFAALLIVVVGLYE